MPTYTARLMGKFAFYRDNQPVLELDSRKAQELLCYLLIYRSRSHTREGLASRLWGELPAAQSRAYLRKALWQLQVAIELNQKQLAGDLLTVEPEWIQVNPNATIDLDVARLEQAADSVQGIPGEGLADADAAEVRGAIGLYQGDLLDGWYQDWCVFERERLLNVLLTLLDKLMAYCEAHGEYESGLAHGTTILRYDRARELTHQRLMRLHFLAGDRSSALRQYEVCASALRDELGVEPTSLTTDLYENLKANRLPEWPSDNRPPGRAAADPSLATALRELQDLSRGIATLVTRFQQKVAALEQAIGKQD